MGLGGISKVRLVDQVELAFTVARKEIRKDWLAIRVVDEWYTLSRNVARAI